MCQRIVFHEIVIFVLAFLFPIQVRLFLFNIVFYLVILYVKSFGLFHLHLGDKDSVGGAIVSFDWSASGWLRMAHFGEACEERTCFLIDKKNLPV